MRRALLAGLMALLWLAGPRVGAAGPHSDAAADASQQVLVLLHLPPQHFRSEAYAGSYGGERGHAARRGLAARLAREHGLTLVTDWPMPLLGVDCYVMKIPSGQSPGLTPDQVAETLSHDARVVWAQSMSVYRAQGGAPEAAAAGHNGSLFPVQPATKAWRLADLHELATGRGVHVAVVDSGVEQSHPNLAGQVDIAENFVDGQAYAAEHHGTAVAGIIGARADNGIGIVGVAPGATLMALRACWQQASREDTLCTSLSLAKALHFAITHDASVVNLSLSTPKNDRLLGLLVDVALSRGITVVAASDPDAPDGGFPASHDGVWAVSDDASRLSRQAVLAPGRDTMTTVPGGGWQLVNGPSYAAAHVAGLAALLHQLGGARAAVPSHQILVLLPAGNIDTCATLLRVTGPRASSCAGAPERSAAVPGSAIEFKPP